MHLVFKSQSERERKTLEIHQKNTAHSLQRDKDYFTAAFSRGTTQAERIQNAIFGMLKENNCQSRILQPAKEKD